MRQFSIFVAVLLVVAATAFAQTEGAVVVDGLNFPEGPLVSDGNLYWVEYGGDAVSVFDGESTQVFIETGEGSGPSGLVQDAAGNFWVTNYETLEVVQYSPDGERLTVIDGYEGAPLRGPNDMFVDDAGGLYFTDSGDFGDDWLEGRLVGAVYYYSPDGDLIQVDSGLRYPNGVELSADGSTLYVNEHRQNQVLAYTVNGDGTYSPGYVFFRADEACQLEAAECYQLGPDGLYRTADGTLYIAHYGGGKVMIVSPDGNLLDAIAMPEGRYPTNVTMNADETVLYVTESETGVIYRFDL